MMLFASILLSGCATILGGKVTDFQRTLPGPGEKQRKIREGYLIADILTFPPFIVVDFLTGAIYEKEKK